MLTTITETTQLVLLRDTMLSLLRQTGELLTKGSLWQVQITLFHVRQMQTTLFHVQKMQITCIHRSQIEKALSKNSFVDILLVECAIMEITANSYMVRETKGNQEPMKWHSFIDVETIIKILLYYPCYCGLSFLRIDILVS